MEAIKNYDIYTEGMKKSLEDKLFFLDMINNVETIIDFGCADSGLLKKVNEKFPKFNLIGIDSDIKMIEESKKVLPCGEFICSKGIPRYFQEPYKCLLNMSSVIHEVYSYSNEAEIEKFWGMVFYSGYRYISIRDLMLSNKSYRLASQTDLQKIISKSNTNQMKDFIDKWGKIKLKSSLLHFLMKYRYVENWERELQENYFPITVEELLSLIPTDLYRIKYFEHYILPFNKKKIFDDFGITLTDNTHVKIILERK